VHFSCLQVQGMCLWTIICYYIWRKMYLIMDPSGPVHFLCLKTGMGHWKLFPWNTKHCKPGKCVLHSKQKSLVICYLVNGNYSSFIKRMLSSTCRRVQMLGTAITAMTSAVYLLCMELLTLSNCNWIICVFSYFKIMTAVTSNQCLPDLIDEMPPGTMWALWQVCNSFCNTL